MFEFNMKSKIHIVIFIWSLSFYISIGGSVFMSLSYLNLHNTQIGLSPEVNRHGK